MPKKVSVVGGGLAGLVAATVCAEAGATVELYEARSRLGGRAATSGGDFATNLGPHAFYAGPLWDWLADRNLHAPFHVPKHPAVRTRWRGRVRRLPPAALLRSFRVRNVDAPVDRTLRDWMTEQAGEDTAEAVAGLAGVLTFDPDPGRLSAKFVWDKFVRIIFAFPPAARYVVGGWGSVIGRLGTHAERLGVTVHTDARVDALDDIAGDGPVVLAVTARAARQLTGSNFEYESPRVALLDLGVERRWGDPYLVLDLDEGAFVDRYSAIDRTVAPQGTSLFQSSIGQRPGEDLDAATSRLEVILDNAVQHWRERAVWRRTATVSESTGAIDLPGTTWQDRQPVTLTPGLHLAGDWLGVPGHLSEVAFHSALEAADCALGEIRSATANRVCPLQRGR